MSDQHLLGPALFQFLQCHNLVLGKRFHFLVHFDAVVTDELGTLAAEGHHFGFRALLARGLYFTLHLFNLSVEVYHSVDKESGRKSIWVVVREEGVVSTFGAGEGFVGASSRGHLVDTSLAIVVTAGQDLGLLEAVLADWTRDLVLQLLDSFLDLFWLVVSRHI